MAKKILVVDNDRLMLGFMEDLFKERGHEVATAEDGISALEILKGFTPDVAFVDLIMPNIRGDKLCRIMRGMPALKDLFLVIISAATLEELENLAETSADAAIAKSSLKEMVPHLLDVLNQSGNNRLDERPKTVSSPQDVYQRKITSELLYAERHLEAILNNISESIFELNPDGKIIFCNNRAFTLSGFSESSLLGRDFAELFKGSDRDKIEKLLSRIGDGPPEVTDRFDVMLNEKRVLLKLLPVEDPLGWSVVAIATPRTKSG